MNAFQSYFCTSFRVLELFEYASIELLCTPQIKARPIHPFLELSCRINYNFQVGKLAIQVCPFAKAYAIKSSEKI